MNNKKHSNDNDLDLFQVSIDLTDAKALCLALMRADSENEVIRILKSSGYWDNNNAWRFYGDSEQNYSTIGNQQSKPEAALVEKIVNAADAVLMNECLIRNIDPESDDAPRSMLDAVSSFFESGSKKSYSGLISEWTNEKRRSVAENITVVATGSKPGGGNPCFSISDRGEGQTPLKMPETLLSLHKKNKVKIPFVQGKFNMGATGSLQFCGYNNLQLVLSRRNPQLITDKDSNTASNWSFTIVRRENPPGTGRNSIYTYLSPIDCDIKPRNGALLNFHSETMPIFPKNRNAYLRESEWGTLIKLYEYDATGFSSNILLKDGLIHKLDILLPEIVLPIRLHECRDYSGHSGSFETTLTGLKVRLDEDKGNNVEKGFPTTGEMKVAGETIKLIIYAFKKGKADTYKKSEGIIFTVNGQTHGSISSDFFRRKDIGLSYLKDSLLIVADCSSFSARAREDLFMNSRDRLREGNLTTAIKTSLVENLKDHPMLRELKDERRKEDIESKLEDSKPLADMLEDLLKKSSVLSDLFLLGKRLPSPFKRERVLSSNSIDLKKFPTYFKFKDKTYGDVLEKECHINMRMRVFFDTDVQNDYFDRAIDPGSSSLFMTHNGVNYDVKDYFINPHNGSATLTVKLPEIVQIGDVVEFTAIVTSIERIEPFQNKFSVKVLPSANVAGGNGTRSKPPSKTHGNERDQVSSIQMPRMIELHEFPGEDQEGWDVVDPAFTKFDALAIKHVETKSENGKDVDIYDFYINVDNLYLKTEQKSKSKEDPRLLKALFSNAVVLIGIALIRQDIEDEKHKTADYCEDEKKYYIEEKVRDFTKAISPIIIPMIEYLGGLEIEE